MSKFLWVFIVFFLFSACAPQPAITAEPVTLTVMAAASLTGAFEELGEQFEAAHPGVEVALNFAGSQQLAQQLALGAPADVFASANQRQMQAVVEHGRIDAASVVKFARNRLVIIYPTENPAGLDGLKDLAQSSLKLVLAAEEVPVGQYSLEFLDKAAAAGYGADYQQRVLENVVSYEENVKSVLTKVALGEADAGVVYTSDVSGADAEAVGQIDIPDELNVIAEYPVAVVADSENSDLGQQFVDFLRSADGQAVLSGYGFISVNP